jgi:hypothetical protein
MTMKNDSIDRKEEGTPEELSVRDQVTLAD